MNCTELTILLPCHSLEDFPLYHSGDEATGLLAAWSVLWHPLLLNQVGKIPTWARCDDPPEDFEQRLMVLPMTHGCDLPSGYAQRVKAGGGRLLRKLTQRTELATAALQQCELTTPPQLSAEVVANFYALGSCYLWTELLTRRMRYMSLLDEVKFQSAVVAAAQAAVDGDVAALQTELQTAFDQLLQARNHFYPVDCFLLDMILVVPELAGPQLRAELQLQRPVTLLCSGETLSQLAKQQPETLELIRSRLQAGTLSIIGGSQSESEYPLLFPEQILADLQQGRTTWQTLLNQPPVHFARRRAGLTPLLPQILKQLEYQTALHVTLDEGRFPTGARSHTSWQGWASQALDSIARVPLDANDPAVFLGLPEKLGDTMDNDQVAELIWVRWPGQVSPFYDDLCRAHQFSPVLGKFVTWDELFAQANNASEQREWNADDYRTPYLVQDVIQRRDNPIGRWSQVASTQQTTTHLITALANYVAGTAINQKSSAGLALLANELGHSTRGATSSLLLVNTTSGDQRQVVNWPLHQPLPNVTGPVLATTANTDAAQVLVQVPSFGFAYLTPVTTSTEVKPARPGWSFWTAKPKPAPLIVQGRELINEFGNVIISPETGGIQAILDQRTRGNRLTQQLGIRLGAGTDSLHWEELPVYTQMLADEISTTINTTLQGEITSRGRLVNPEGEVVAHFIQRTRLAAHCPVIEIDVELNTTYGYRAEPWNSYAAIRWAWGDELAQIWRSVHQTTQQTDAKRIEATDFLELREVKRSTTILCHGLPYHQRVGTRRLDTILQVKGETTQRFRLALVLDATNSAIAAEQFVTPLSQLPVAANSTAANSGWLLHIDLRGVIVTSVECLFNEQRVIGLRMRLLETIGQAGPVSIRGIRNWTKAEKVTFTGLPLEQLETHQDQVRLYLAANEWCEVHAYWTASGK